MTRRQNILMISAMVLAIGLAAVAIWTSSTAKAYGTASGSYTSLGCWFTGYSEASTSRGHSDTVSQSCADRSRLRMDYKTGGSWYLYSDVWYYTNGSPLMIFFNRWSDTEMVFGTHQVWVSGAWRQEEYTMTW